MKITVVTQAYNAKKYIEQCIRSVLEQTYSDLEYILIDNGCNDGSEEIIHKFAQRDSRIKLVRFETNVAEGRWYEPFVRMAEGEYYSQLDADDWIEPDYLEKMVKTAQETNSDVIATGSFMHFEANGHIDKRKLNERLVLEKRQYDQFFSNYHVFFRAGWAKLIKSDIIKNTPLLSSENIGFTYGLDTMQTFQWLKRANKICIDNSILHHYRIHQKSVSHQYDPRQSYSDLYLFNDALDFLSPYGPISENNLLFLHVVYSNAVNDTLNNIKSSSLTASEKLEEYYKILERPVTKACCKRTHEDITNNKAMLFTEMLKAFSELEEIPPKWNEILSFYFPKCHEAFSTRSAKLALMEPVLLKELINDNPISVIKALCSPIVQNKYSKQFDLPQILQSLTQNHPLLSGISDPTFLKKYSGIYLSLYQDKYGDALNIMTDTLLKEKVNNETFLQTYVNIAALLEQVDEFIFGKIKTAGFYLSEKRLDECGEILYDLQEMGVEDNEEISNMKAKLNEQLS